MENLEKYGLVDPLLQSIEKGKPYLGICLGLQILFSESEEFGSSKGLDLIRGNVVKFWPDPEHKVPHMGWNTIEKEKEVPMLKGVEDGDFFYFVHSYYVVQKRHSGSPRSLPMANLLFPASGKIISLPPNSTRRRVSRKVEDIGKFCEVRLTDTIHMTRITI